MYNSPSRRVVGNRRRSFVLDRFFRSQETPAQETSEHSKHPGLDSAGCVEIFHSLVLMSIHIRYVRRLHHGRRYITLLRAVDYVVLIAASIQESFWLFPGP